MLRGTIVAFDPADGLGTIELEDGRRVRFAMRHLHLEGAPLPGKEVLVDDLEHGYAGQLRATAVRDASATEPNLGDVERLFATRLPAALRDAWASGSDDRLLAMTADELVAIAERVCGEHAYAIRAVDGKPFALLPFARGEEDRDYYVLDLAWPTGDGDFAVRLVQHDVVDGIDVVAPSSAAWLAKR